MSQRTATVQAVRPSVDWYIAWGLGSPGPLRQVKAHIRESRPTTRLWMDVLLPLSVLSVVTVGAIPWRAAGLFVLAMLFLHYAATLLNDVQDAETDSYSPEPLRRSRPIAAGTISRRVALVEMGVFVVLGITAAALVRWELGLACAVLILLVSQHELPPLRTQSRPLFSPIAGLIGLTGIMACVCLAAGTVPALPAVLFMVFVVVYLGAGEMLVKDVRDVGNDARGGKQTTSVRYGASRSAKIAVAVYVVATLCYTAFAVVLATSGSVGRGTGLLLGTVVLLAWIAVAARASSAVAGTGAGTSAGRLLHRGSVTTFSTVAALVVVVHLAS